MYTIQSSCSVNTYCKSSKNTSSTARIVEWLEGNADKRGIAGSNPSGGINYHFEFFAYFPLITARRRPYKRNQA